MGPEDRSRLTEQLADLTESDRTAFLGGHGLVAAYQDAGQHANNQAGVIAAFGAAERQGRLEQVLVAAREFVDAAEARRQKSWTSQDLDFGDGWDGFFLVDRDMWAKSPRNPDNWRAERAVAAARAEDRFAQLTAPTASGESNEEENTLGKPARVIFISHANADGPVAQLLNDALNLAGIPDDEVFFSFARSTGIAAGRDIPANLRKALDEAKLVIELISETYLTRPMCLMEFGAAWAMFGAVDDDMAAGATFPIVLEPLKRSDVTPQLGNVYMYDLVGTEAVDQMLDDLHASVGVATGRHITAAQWSKCKRHFRNGLAALAATKPDLRS